MGVPDTSLRAYLNLRELPLTTAFLGFLLYFIVVTTYIAPLGTIAMALGVVGLVVGAQRVTWPPPVTFFLLFWLWAALATVLSPYLGTLDPLWDVGKVLIVFLVAVNALKNPTALRFFVLAYVACFALYPARGTVFNYFIYHNADFGRAAWRDTFGNPNDMAALTLLALGAASGFLHREVPRVVRSGAMLAMVVFPVVILLTQSRAGIIGMAAFVLMAVLTTSKRKFRTLLWVGIAATIAIAIAPADVWQRVGGLTNVRSAETIAQADPEGSALQRWQIWQTGARVIADHPVLGVGIGRYPAANASYSSDLGARDLHSTYLLILAETGVPGLLLFLGLVASCLRAARAARARAIAFAGGPEWRQLRLLEFGLYAFLIACVWGSFGLQSLLYVYLAMLYAQSQAVRGLVPDTSQGDGVILGDRKRRASRPQHRADAAEP